MRNNMYIRKFHSILINETPFLFFFMLLMGLPQAIKNLTAVSGFYSLITSLGNIGIIFLYAYLCALLYSAIKPHKLRSIYKTAMYVLAVVINGICFYALTDFKLTISPTWFLLLSETTPNESSEFVGQYFFSSTMLKTITNVIIYTCCIILLEKKWSSIKEGIKKFIGNIQKVRTVFVSIALAFAVFSSLYLPFAYIRIHQILYSVSDEGQQDLNWIPQDPFSSIYFSITSLDAMGKKTEENIKINQQVYSINKPSCALSDSLNIVVIVGESYIKYHSQLYGYPLATTPLLCEERDSGRLFVFNDVISTSNRTSIAMRNILSCNNSCSNEAWYHHPNFLTIFKSAGYNVYMWDNQRDFTKKNNLNYTLNNYLYNPTQQEITYTQTNDRQYVYDGELVESFNETIDLEANKHNIVLFHLMGHHHNVEQRFPHEQFKQFSSDNIDRNESYIDEDEKEYIANYDNTTLYNDYVIRQIIEQVRNTNSILLYFSDHGEEVYSYRDQCGRDDGPLTANKLKFQFDIPFIVWCSDTFKTKNPDIVEQLCNSTNKAFAIDNLCHLLFHIGKIDTHHYNEERNLISSRYKCGKRIMHHKYDYDEIRFDLR